MCIDFVAITAHDQDTPAILGQDETLTPGVDPFGQWSIGLAGHDPGSISGYKKKKLTDKQEGQNRQQPEK